MNVDDILNAIPAQIRDLKVGSVLYSGRGAWCRADRPEIYLLGFNPGGNPGIDSKTLYQQATEALEKERHSNFVHESWDLGVAEGAKPMQRRVRALFDILGMDLSLTPASNVLFARSAQISHLAPEVRSEWEAICWTFHQEMIDRLQPEIIVCMGNDAYGFVSQRKPGPPVVKIRHTSRSKRTWAEDQAPIIQAALDVAAHPRQD